MKILNFSGLLLFAVTLVAAAGASFAADHAQWGERHTRNMVSPERGLPSSFDLASGENILWSLPLAGSYGSPIVAGGKVFIGANNAQPRDPRHQGDRAVMLCLNAADGSLIWQFAVPRTGECVYLDYPNIGMCSPPTIEGDRAYTVTNRSEVVCLDINGFANGNTGPFRDEAAFLTPPGEPTVEPGPLDADIVWLFDLRKELGVYPHDSQYVSILLDGDYLYLNTGNGVDNTHVHIRSPEAPSLVVLDKRTGRLVATDGERIGPQIFHCTWSSPALGEVNGRRLIFFGGGDGVCYAFNALRPGAPETPRVLEQVWRFDTDPTAPKENVHDFSRNFQHGPSTVMSMPVFHDNRVYVTAGGDIWWGKHMAWLKCIDATGEGDVTETGEIWSYPLERSSSATPAVYDGMVFVTDGGGNVHCVNAETGEPYWTHKAGNAIWGCAFVADGKVYVGARNGEFSIFAADKTKNLLFSTRFADEINGTPTAAGGVLYIPTLRRFYAIKEEG